MGMAFASLGAMSDFTVLIVDDHRLTRETLAESVVDMGGEAVLAARGLEALRILDQSPCQVLVSDVDMPDITGFELIRRMHERQWNPAVLLMSARFDSERRQAAHLLGIRDLIEKPVSLPIFTQTLQRIRNHFLHAN
jgi:CheY-like chemotaxis protein